MQLFSSFPLAPQLQIQPIHLLWTYGQIWISRGTTPSVSMASRRRAGRGVSPAHRIEEHRHLRAGKFPSGVSRQNKDLPADCLPTTWTEATGPLPHGAAQKLGMSCNEGTRKNSQILIRLQQQKGEQAKSSRL